MRRERGKTPSEGLGRALVRKNQLSHSTKRRDGRLTNQHYHHQPDDIDEQQQYKLDSIMERNALDEFLTNAIMEEQDFAAQKTNVVLISGSTVVSIQPKLSQEQLEYEHVRIPRRPEWNHTMAADELQRQERESFLAWRRELANYEESSVNKHSTPFEKNLEVWKQLWRVTERSHVVTQIVDARNPLLFYCKDVFTFAKEMDTRKRCVLIINKSDFLTREARKQWGDYFDNEGIEYIFWSAKQENVDQQHHIDRLEELTQRRLARASKDRTAESIEESAQAKAAQNDKKEPVNPFAELFNDDEDEDAEAEVADATETISKTTTSQDDCDDDDYDEDSLDEDDIDDGALTLEYESKIFAKDKYDIYGRTQLIELLRSLADRDYIEDMASSSAKQRISRGLQPDHGESHKVNIGLLGFPNVGKSSTINALLGMKKVSVAATPGHTKHFQTLALEDDLVLCDCPGLVFPTFVHSKHALVVHGVIPIDTLRDYMGPIDVLCQKIPRSQIIEEYGIDIPTWKTMDATTLLQSYCKVRSFYKQAGTLDEARAARIFLKDFVNGKLLFCQCPPSSQNELRRQFYESYRSAEGSKTRRFTESVSNFTSDMQFISETEQMTNSQLQLLAKHASTDDTQKQDTSDVIDVTISRQRIVTVQPNVDSLTLKQEQKSYRQNLDDLQAKDMSKKQARRLQKSLLKNKKTISASGGHLVQNTASRMAGKAAATHATATSSGGALGSFKVL